MMTAIARTSLAEGPEAARRLLDLPSVQAIEIVQPPLEDLPYRDLVGALLRAQGFKLDFHGQAPDAAVAMVADRLIGPDAFRREAALLAEDIAALAGFAGGLVGGTRPLISLRTYFAPGDLVWHVDRVNERTAFRLLWPLGRPAGMRVTPADNINQRRYGAYMRREHPLLCQLDSRVLATGGDVEALWAHRPAQLAAMASGRFPFLLDPARQWEVQPGFASVHAVQTPVQPGAYHRSSWSNRKSPGLQVVITASSN